jgi:hypothetical protein
MLQGKRDKVAFSHVLFLIFLSILVVFGIIKMHKTAAKKCIAWHR